MSLVEARGEWGKAKDLLKDGIDPSHQRKVEKITKVQNTANSIESVKSPNP